MNISQLKSVFNGILSGKLNGYSAAREFHELGIDSYAIPLILEQLKSGINPAKIMEDMGITDDNAGKAKPQSRKAKPQSSKAKPQSSKAKPQSSKAKPTSSIDEAELDIISDRLALLPICDGEFSIALSPKRGEWSSWGIKMGEKSNAKIMSIEHLRKALASGELLGELRQLGLID